MLICRMEVMCEEENGNVNFYSVYWNYIFVRGGTINFRERERMIVVICSYWLNRCIKKFEIEEWKNGFVQNDFSSNVYLSNN